MGLLDDAIREHLELKRLRGADPGEVARAEQDALGPVRREEEAAQDDHEPSETAVSSDTTRSLSGGTEPKPAADPSDPSSPGQQTVEINMEAELSAVSHSDPTSAVAPTERAAPVAHPAHMQGAAEDSLEWEMPGESTDLADLQDVDDPKLDGDGEDGEHVEDVLEETPDFLRDTPEQERLWFEQRPPRDFDFNE
jgi:hypothetical protein